MIAATRVVDRSRAAPRPARPTVALPLALVLAGGACATASWALTGNDVVALAALALFGAGALAAAVTAPVAFVLVFVAVRPLLDLGPTYGRGPDLNSPSGALVLVALASWAFRHRRELVGPTAPVWAAVALAAAGFLSVLGSPDHVQSMNMALRVFTVVGLFAFAEQVGRRDPAFVPRLIASILVSVGAVAVVTILQIVDVIPLPVEYRRGEVFDAQLLRPPGPYPAPTVLATHVFLGLGLLMYVVPRVWASTRWHQVTAHLLVGAGLLGWIVLENKSRGPSVAILIVVTCVFTVRWRWVGAAFAILLLCAGIATIDASAARLDEVGSGVTPGAETDTLAWRVEYWKANLPRLADSPVTGIGLGRVEQLNAGGNPPHSTAVQSIVEMGLAGAAAYLALAVTLLVALLRALRRSFSGALPSDTRALVLVVAALCLGYVFIGLFENLLTQVVTSGPIALLTGATLARAAAGPFTSAQATASRP